MGVVTTEELKDKVFEKYKNVLNDDAIQGEVRWHMRLHNLSKEDLKAMIEENSDDLRSFITKVAGTRFKNEDISSYHYCGVLANTMKALGCSKYKVAIKDNGTCYLVYNENKYFFSKAESGE